MSLADCFKKLGKNIHSADKKAIENLVANGWAEIDAVNQVIGFLQQDIEAIATQAQEQGAEVAYNDPGAINGGVTGQEFESAAKESLAANKNAPSADIYPAEDYNNHNLYLLDDGKAGFAIHQNGTIMSVFKHPDSNIKGALDVLIPLAVREGGTRLEAFEGFLTEGYARNGFVEVDRMAWDEQYRPDGWTDEMGTPDLVIMEFDNERYNEITGKTSPETLQELKGIRRENGPVRRATEGDYFQSGGDRGGRDQGRSLAPLEGAPTVEGSTGPDPALVSVAEAYAASIGIDLQRQSEYVQVNEDRARSIADAFEKMEHAPNDPVVREAYENLIQQTTAQYQALVSAGYDFYFMDPANDPYDGNPWNAMRDLRANKSMAVFPTNEGFGSDVTFDVSENPLMQDTGITWRVGKDGDPQPVLANDLFRAVHDAFGHGLEGAGFRARGEENAWQAHVKLFTGSAVGAITSETRGQNSWLNYGPHGEKNQTAKVEDTVFADQKIGLMPEWTWKEGIAGSDTLYQSSVKLRKKKETLKKYGLDPGREYKTRDVAAALEARQRDKAGIIGKNDKSNEAKSKIAKWMAEEVMFELENPERSGAGWYSTKFQAALDKFGDAFPELKTDQSARDLMTALIAITSDGQKVVPNFAMAADYYKNYRETGKLTSSRGHQRQDSINGNIERIQSMLESMGPEKMREYLMHEKTVSELKKIAKETGIKFSTAYKADVEMPMAAVIFGPKLGAFYANLMGAHGYLTMDRWWSRTFNRYRGTLLQAPTRQGLDRFKELMGDPSMSDDQVLSAVIEPRNSYEAKNYKNGTEIEKAANTIYKAAFENIEDAPYNASDRSFMLDAVNQAQKNLKRRGHDISIADIQAILWYYEKRLYGELGTKKTADISYEEAAERVTAEITATRSGGQDAQGFDGSTTEGSESLQQIPRGPGTPVGEENFLSGGEDRDEQRGSITFSNLAEGFAKIMLSPKANQSTLMHEGAHLFLEIYTSLSQDMSVAPRIQNDFNKIMDWFGLSRWDWYEMSIDEKRGYHEMFAESFEQYLREGKAPSVKLESAFRKFKSWLTQIYKSITDGLPNADLNDEIRGVFDRMIASEEEIAEMEAISGYKPLFDSAEDAGMTSAEFESYKTQQEKATGTAEEALLKKAMKQIKRIKSEWWRSESQSMAKAVKAELEQERVYAAIERIKSMDWKLDRDYVKELLGVTKLPKQLSGMTQKNGFNVEEAAKNVGYENAAEMLNDFVSSDSIAEATKKEVERRMIEKHGDVLSDGSIKAEAENMVHNPERAKLVMKEINALARKNGTESRVRREALKARAKKLIGSKRLRDLKPESYYRAEVQAAANAAKAKAEGNLEEAQKYKEQQLWAFLLYREARDAKEIEAKGAAFARKLSRGAKLNNLQSAGDQFLDQAARILAKFEFKKVSNKELDSRIDMRSWVNNVLADAGEGSPVPMHENLTEEQKQILIEAAEQDTMGGLPNVDMIDSYAVKNYRELSLDEFNNVIDSLKMVDHLARAKNRLLTQEDKKTMDEWVTELTTSIEQYAQQKNVDAFGSTESPSQRRKQAFREFMDSSRTVTSIAKMLDGYKDNGVVWRLIIRPLQEAAAKQTDMMHEANKKVEEMFSAYTKSELKDFSIRRFDERLQKTISKQDALSVLLNWGNSQNRQRIIDGEGITEADAQYIMDTYLNERDFEFAKQMWAFLDSYKEEAFALHRDLYGFTPPEVEPEPFETRYGTMPGGYYPIKYDPVRSSAAEQNLAEKQGQSNTKSVKSRGKLGSNIARARTVTRAMNTDVLAVVQSHLNDVIHQVSHDRAIYDAGRLLSNDKVKKAITDSHGRHFYQAMITKIRDIRDGTEPAKDALDRWVMWMRNNATLAMLGSSVRTILLQPFGVTNSIAQVRMSGVGMNSLIKGYADYMSHGPTRSKQIRELSQYMKNREETQSVAINRIKNKIRKTGTFDKVKEASMLPMMKVQFHSVDAPLWLAVYNHHKATLDKDTAVQLADQAVRDAQGGGDIIDTAQAMMGGPFRKLFTNFLTYMITTYNLQSQNFQKTFKLKEQGIFDFAVNSFVLMTLPSILMALLNEFVAGEDDDEDFTERLIREQASFLLSMNPIGAQFSGAVTGFDYSGPQGTALISKTIDLSVQAGQGEADAAFWRSLSWVIGLGTGLPAAQFNRSAFGLSESIENNESAGMTVKQTLFGPER